LYHARASCQLHRARHTFPHGGRWWIVPLLAGVSLLSTAAAHAEVGIVAQLPPSATSSATPRNAEAVDAVERSLDRVGISHRRINSSLLSERTLRPFEVVVLPELRMTDAGTESLRQFAERGGRWVAYRATGSPALDTLLDLRPIPPVPPNAELRFIVPEARLGMPAKLPVAPGTQPRMVEAGSPTHTAGRWNVAYAPAPLVRGPHGYFVNVAPGDGDEHSDALLAMLGDLEPTFWPEALANGRVAALREIREATLRWADLRGRPDLITPQRRRIESALQGLRARLPQSEQLPSEVEGNRIVIAERVRVALEVQSSARRLIYQMSAPRKGEVRGIWINPTARQDWDSLMRKVRDAGLNTVFVRAARGGSALYPSDVLSTTEGGKGSGDELSAAIEAARKQGLAFHAVRVSFDLEGAPAAFTTRMTSEDRLARDATGKQVAYLNPGDPRNTELEYQAIMELVRKYDLDGFQFASIRYPGDPHATWDYGPISRREFEKAKAPVERWPEDVISGAKRRDYDDWQRDNLNRLVQRVAAEIKRIKPHVQISAAVEPGPAVARAAVKQDWPVWIQQGWLDFLVPLAASSAADVLAAAVDTQVNTTRGRIPLLVGLGGQAGSSPTDLLLQIETSREQGAEGFVIAGAEAGELDERLAALRAGATSEGTWPGYQAPRAEWSITPSMQPNRLPLTLAAGDRGQIEVKLNNVSPARLALKSASAELRLEDPAGRFLGLIGGLNGFGIRKSRFEAPAGRFRPVLRGNMAFADGTIRPFVIRGPICNGVSPDELAALRAQDSPPVVSGNGRKIAVYADAEGSTQLLDAYRAGSNGVVFPLYRLQPDHLTKADVLVLPTLKDVSDFSQPAVQALRDWVSNGGTLLLLGDAAGAGWHPRLFPEIGVGQDSHLATTLQAAKALGPIKAGESIGEFALAHSRLLPAAGAEILVTEAGEPASVVGIAGQVGKGRVILYGGAPGSTGEPVSDAERGLLLALLAPR